MLKNIPTVFIIFGATGDLISKKIIPALLHLYQKDKLPKLIRIIGFSRRGYSDRRFQQYVHFVLSKHEETSSRKKETEKFVSLFSYHQGNFNENASYKMLARKLGRVDEEWKVCSNKLFYLAVPPHYYRSIFHHLADSGLTIPCGPDEGWTRVIVEKPFGKDLKTAEELDLLLAKLFKEEQIYRIDHYLAKEMLQNILTFRFANNFLEQSWNNTF
ncbi:glucose-6-phosphate dehydrogenase, partial [Candidatus Roizmanbacteria bacterium]|nr:glucose-6-phosphate dehydrogenase [Candidatus Roizmanbacteria bacterium]